MNNLHLYLHNSTGWHHPLTENSDKQRHNDAYERKKTVTIITTVPRRATTNIRREFRMQIIYSQKFAKLRISIGDRCYHPLLHATTPSCLNSEANIFSAGHISATTDHASNTNLRYLHLLYNLLIKLSPFRTLPPPYQKHGASPK